MFTSSKLGIGMLLALLCAVLMLLGAVSAQSANAPLELTFEKCDPEGDFVWNGTVSGDVAGDLTTMPTFVDDTQKVWQVAFDFVIGGEQPMILHLVGTLNTNTGQVVLNGEVVEGDLQGARVHEMGQLVDAEQSCFEGTISIQSHK